jgi:hypothetical protein
MKYYISDIIPSIKRYSKKLDEDALLLNHDWVLFNDTIESRTNYIFRKNEELIITEKGIGKRTKWQNIGNQRLLIEQDGMLLQFNVFFDEIFLILNLNDTDTYAFLINENKYDGELNSIEHVIDFLTKKYIEPQTRKNLADITGLRLDKPIIKNKPEIVLMSYHSDKGTIEIEQTHNAYPDIDLGRKVLWNGKPAPDGKYRLGFMWYVYVKDGFVLKVALF